MNRAISKFLFAGLLAAVPIAAASAGGLTVLHTFHGGKDGMNPSATLVADASGTLYGTTRAGGNKHCGGGAGCGTVFAMTKFGKLTILHAFKGGKDGAVPFVGLTFGPDGLLYGTTNAGGTCPGQPSGCGTVFRIRTDGTKEKIVYAFQGGADGISPQATVTFDAGGNLYGTTLIGGDGCSGSDCGTVFKIAPNGTKTILHSFTGGNADGSQPQGGLVFDAAGNLYGTALIGGNGCSNSSCGVMFKIASDGTESVLHNFTNLEGWWPKGDLAIDASGNLYGASQQGAGCNLGSVWKLTAAGVETTLHSFCGAGSHDGAFPEGGVMADTAGNLYGTLPADQNSSPGFVFEIAPDGTETILYQFTGHGDGKAPAAGLYRDALGKLYGTSYNGGLQFRHCGTDGCGTVFRLVP